jgi:hypothetical protein
MRSSLSFFLILISNFIPVESRAENLFFTDPIEPLWDDDLVPEKTEFFDIDFNSGIVPTNEYSVIDPLGQPWDSTELTETIFDDPGPGFDPEDPFYNDENPLAWENEFVDANPFYNGENPLAWENEFVDADPVSLAALPSSCQAQEFGLTSGILRARSGEVCVPNQAGDFGLPLDLGTEAWFRRVPQRNPAPPPPGQKPPPPPGIYPPPENVPELSQDAFSELVQQVETEKKRCPREFPRRCCSDHIAGYQVRYSITPIHFIFRGSCPSSM